MAVQTVEQVKRLPPYLEGLQKRLLSSLYGTFDGATQTQKGLLDRKLDLKDLERLRGDVIIEGRKVFIDAVSYVEGQNRTEVGIEIHSGRNRIVRKIFEHVGYKVTKLDRVIFAELTKKNLPRGRWRELTKQEIFNLQMM